MFKKTLLSIAIMNTLSSNCFRSLDTLLLFEKSDYKDLIRINNFVNNYKLNNYNSNFNSKNNFRTQIYNSGRNSYSRKHN